jgi:hypothetical protein
MKNAIVRGVSGALLAASLVFAASCALPTGYLNGPGPVPFPTGGSGGQSGNGG